MRPDWACRPGVHSDPFGGTHLFVFHAVILALPISVAMVVVFDSDGFVAVWEVLITKMVRERLQVKLWVGL